MRRNDNILMFSIHRSLKASSNTDRCWPLIDAVVAGVFSACPSVILLCYTLSLLLV